MMDPFSESAPDCLALITAHTTYKIDENYVVHSCNNDEQAILRLRLIKSISVFAFVCAFRNPCTGKVNIVTRNFASSTHSLLELLLQKNSKKLPVWLKAKIVIECFRIADHIHNLGAAFRGFTPNEIVICPNGGFYFVNLNKITGIEDTPRMLKQIGELIHYLFASCVLTYRDGVPLIQLDGTFRHNNTFRTFIERCTSGDAALYPQFPLGNLCSINLSLDILAGTKECFYLSYSTPPSQCYSAGCIVEVNNKNELVRNILDAIGRLSSSDLGKCINVVFHLQNAVGMRVSSSHITEAWRTFLLNHSLWITSSDGFFMTQTPMYCRGCGTNYCHLSSPERYKQIGKWLANTLCIHPAIYIPFPLHPMFVHSVCGLDGLLLHMSDLESIKQHKLVVQGKEDMLKLVRSGFYFNPMTEKLYSRFDIYNMVQRLCHPWEIRAEQYRIFINIFKYNHDSEEARCASWFGSWFSSKASDWDLKCFFMETYGTLVPDASLKPVDIIICKKSNGTVADVCKGSLTLPCCTDKQLFEAILQFREPLLFTTK